MNVASIIVIALIVVVSVVAVATAEEPIDELFHIEAAQRGFSLPPLAAKITARRNAAAGNATAGDLAGDGRRRSRKQGGCEQGGGVAFTVR